MGGTACTLGSGIDYIDADTSVTFIAGDMEETVNVVICSDSPFTEPTETINLDLTGPGVGSPSSVDLSVIDIASQYKKMEVITIGGAPVTPDAPDGGNPYPSFIDVAGQPNIIGSLRVTLFNYSHTIPDNVDVMLVGPTGVAFILMADAGGTMPITPGDPVTLSFTDAGIAVLPDDGPLFTANVEPTSWTTPIAPFPPPAPATFNEPGPMAGGSGTQTLIGNYGGSNPNGRWNLYIRQQGGGTGQISGGWGIEFLAPTAASATISGRVLTANGQPIRNAKVTITGNTLIEPLRATTGSFGYYSFDGLQVGETYVVTVASKRFTFAVPSRVISLIDNVADADFIAEPQE